ncbi:MAG: DUF5984 family protein [Archangium sp.]|nr:DUF5984 family protein [Archangium sp.]MDP3570979.1 DUF5984 family protein [Archangium sp.]
MFRFELRGIETITPWGPATAPTLSWFGLSDGWSWLQLGGQEVLRAADASGESPPYLDYQVVRLWEDLLDLLPSALAPLPADVAAALRDEDSWLTRVEGDLLEVDENGLSFWSRRKLSLLHLSAPPRVWFWRDGHDLRVVWRPAQEDRGHWVAASGSLKMPVATFLAEVRSFDQAFLSAMQERVETITKAGGIPGVAIDLAHLDHEQRERATWLENTLARPAPDEDWGAVRRLLAAPRA